MTDQNQFQDPQTQGTQDDNQNDDIFGGSDDIFANSDILKPIDENGESKVEETAPENTEVEAPVQSQDDFDVEKNDSVVEEVVEEVEEKKEPEVVETMPQENNGDDDFFDPFNEETEELAPIKEDVIEEKLETPEVVEQNDESNDDIFENTVEETPMEVAEEDVLEERETTEEPIEQLEEIVDEPEEIEEIVENKDNLVEEEIEETKIEEPNFEESPEIDALDDLDDLDIDNIEEVKEKKEINIDEVIKNIEEKAKSRPDYGTNLETEMETPEKDNGELKMDNVKLDGPENEEIKNEVVEQKTEEAEEEIEEKVEEPIENVVKKNDEPAEETQDEKFEVNPLKTDLQNKFEELLRKAKAIHELVKNEEVFELIGGNDDRTKTTYKMSAKEDHVEIIKEELNKAYESTQSNKLDFLVNRESLNVLVDDELLYDEVNDLQENPNKKMQVMEKLNKFIFLVNEEYKKMEKEIGEKEKRHKMKGIFRNFMF